MDNMIKKINSFKNGEKLIVIWGDDNNRITIEGTIDTIYESDNCLDEDDPNYKEFYACAFKVDKVLDAIGNSNMEVGKLIEISVDNQPVQIFDINRNLIWDINIDGL
ncbi:hypothetical protein [Butyrivibrio sp. INlla21]|uniref:hypothetical protein n=1 Tax=Butyrivibrio sp. INlla21 TaxID=1520811 RepID=UPI0008EADF2B|nr:hypothetical protein [Butyrivibrio sp. INlla21]SFU84816.1 hypothetical protein SAMN02910342_02040 [Butyrivibrio sp. INlla21]